MPLNGLKTWTTSDAVSADNLNANNSVLESKFSAGIETEDIANSAVTNAKIENTQYEIVLTLRCDGVRFNAAADGEMLDFVGLPADVDAEDYDIKAIDYTFYNTANPVTAGDDIDIHWGYFGAASGGLGNFTSIGAAVALPALSANEGIANSVSPSTSSVTLSTTNKNFFALERVSANGGANAWDAQDQMLIVSIKLQRTNGLRS